MARPFSASSLCLHLLCIIGDVEVKEVLIVEKVEKVWEFAVPDWLASGVSHCSRWIVVSSTDVEVEEVDLLRPLRPAACTLLWVAVVGRFCESVC